MLPLFSEYSSLDDARKACSTCISCSLSATREEVVFGNGNPDADVMFIGQGPSLPDNRSGLPYSGPAGDLLDQAMAQAGMRREDVWITNLHKCVATKVNPKTNQIEMRPPKVAEVTACRPWLDEELFWIKPQVLVTIGGPAAQTLLGKDFQLSDSRGQWQIGPNGIDTIATFQPTYLKRLSQWDRPAAVQGWRDLVADLTLVKEKIDCT